MPSALELGKQLRRTRGPVAVNYRAASVLLIAGFAALNIFYLVAGCPHDLAPDEAHYWDWSRHLDWCYYSKGPLVAWLVRASCELFGNTMPAVRLPAVLGHALLMLALHRLTLRAFGNERLAFVAIALGMTVPALAALGVMMTIDSPYLCCWAWACVFAQSASASASEGGTGVSPVWLLGPARRRSHLMNSHLMSWVAAGLIAALGILAKYTMLLFPVCVGLYLLTSPDRRHELRRGGFWLMCGLAALGLVPIVVWNITHDWIGFRHVFALANGKQSGFDPLAVPHFFAGQFGILIGYWFLAWVLAVVAYRPWRNANPQTAFLWWMSVPVCAAFLLAGLKTRGEANWPAAAYITGFVLTVGWLAEQWNDPNPRYRRQVRGWLAFGVLLGVAISFVTRYPGAVRPVLAQLAAPPTADNPTPIRKLDLTGRLHGWRALAATVDELREQVRREEGREPLVAGMTWTLPGELGFYCRGNPQVYTFGPVLSDRHSQYDIWRPNPLADAQAFRGRTFVYVGEINKDLQQAFDRAGSPVEVLASDGGIPVADWKVWVLRGFRGFSTGRRGAGY
jgi:4-amino-4-deoxy-L-arabinose transferase-like glycosyltransferase